MGVYVRSLVAILDDLVAVVRAQDAWQRIIRATGARTPASPGKHGWSLTTLTAPREPSGGPVVQPGSESLHR